MKIAMLCHPSVGGSGILATTLGYEIAELGHQVTFISTKTPFRLIEHHPNIQFDEVKPVDFPLFQHPDSTLPLISHLLQKTREEEFDIVHAHYAVPNAAAAVIAKKLSSDSRFKIMTTLHGTDVVKLGESPEYSEIIQTSLEGSDVVTCVSDKLKKLTQDKFSGINESQTIHNFYRKRKIEKNRETIRNELGLRDEKLVIHLSNLRKVKRIDLLLETFAKALKQTPMKLLILGGADFSVYQDQVEALGLSDHLIFCRDVVHVQDYIEAADVGIFCSEYESFCLGVLECMAHGVPVVAFDVGGIPEVLDHGSSGYLQPFGETGQLANDLTELIRDNRLRLELSLHAKQRAESLFSPERAVERYLNLYQQLVG